MCSIHTLVSAVSLKKCYFASFKLLIIENDKLSKTFRGQALIGDLIGE